MGPEVPALRYSQPASPTSHTAWRLCRFPASPDRRQHPRKSYAEQAHFVLGVMFRGGPSEHFAGQGLARVGASICSVRRFALTTCTWPSCLKLVFHAGFSQTSVPCSWPVSLAGGLSFTPEPSGHVFHSARQICFLNSSSAVVFLLGHQSVSCSA